MSDEKSDEKNEHRGDGLRDLGNGVLEIVDPAAMVAVLKPVVDRNLATQNDADPAQSGEGWSGSIGGACPVQGDGVVDGRAWYFRARGRHWSLSVAWRDGVEPASVTATGEDGWYMEGEADEKDDFAASWMRHSEAWRHIGDAIAAHREWKEQRRAQRAERPRIRSSMLLAAAAIFGGVGMALPFTSTPEFADAGPFDHEYPQPPSRHFPPMRRPQQYAAPITPTPRVLGPAELAAQAKRDRKKARRRGGR